MLDETYQSYSSDIAAAASQSVKERDYWLKKLSGDLEKTGFPYDYDYLLAAHDTASKDNDMDKVAIQFPEELSEKLLWISNKSDSRLLMILMAGLAALLNKYTGDEDIILGMPIYKQEIQGKFINTVLPQRNHLQQDITFKELLYQVKQTIDESVQNQNYPMKALLYELNLPYSEVDFPLFDLDLLLENIQDKSYIQHIHTKMRFLFSRREEFLEGALEYNPVFYSQDTAARIITHYLSLLKGALADVNLPLSRLDLLSEGERKKILEDFNNTAKQYLDPQGLSMQETGTLLNMFTAQVAKTPGNTAVIDADQDSKITYRELNTASNRLAGFLKKAGLTPGTIAAVALQHPVKTVTAILAVLKTGACYLPIDHDYPGDRKQYMLLDSEARMLIGESLEEITKDIPAITTVIDFDSSGQEIAAQSDEDLEITIPPASPAYVIYTSGTTGTPKGVVVEHRHAVNTLCCRREAYNMTPGDVALQLFSYSFDGFITSFFTPLFSGTPIVLLSKSDIKDLFKIKEVISRYRVTHFISVPTLYHSIIDSLSKEEAESLKVVTLAGEAVNAKLLEITRDKNPRLEIVNEYGVTEGAVMSTLFRHQQKAKKIKIGKPIANTQLYILNEENRLQPIGLPGELCITGSGVARGYLNNPELTAQKFTPRTYTDGIRTNFNQKFFGGPGGGFSKKPPGRRRLYKTGDMGRWDKDGNIELLGRIDHQVKLRGFRIEPGEIENRLNAHPAVKESHVIVVENAAGDKQLAAYLVPDPEKAFTVRQLLHLQQEGVLEKQQLLTLPGNLPLGYINRQEVEPIFEKLFTERAYLKHGITLDKGACVFDVGAHIGLFSVFVKENYPGAVIYAFEPLPPIFEVLKLNTSLYGINARLFSFGFAAAKGEESFTFYPNASGFSGRFPDKKKEMAVIGSFIHGRQESGDPTDPDSEPLSETEINELLEERLTRKQYQCPTQSISQFIRENGVKHIDLLKITSERSELEILKGIEKQDWPKIHQLVIEVDNGDGRLEGIKNLLQNHGYHVTIDQDEEMKNSDVYSVYARLASLPEHSRQTNIKNRNQLPSWHSPQHLQDDIKTFLARGLPDFMVPQAYVLLEQMPLTPNGKVDRKQLPHPDTLVKTDEFVAPRDNIEKHLVEIWAELLDTEQEVIGIDANFFELGGHSLTATILASRIHREFNIKIPMTEIFKTPRIRSIAEYINTAARESFVAIQPAEEKEYYPLSSAQNRFYVLQTMLSNTTAYNINEVHELEGEPDLEKYTVIFKQLIQRHESLRTSFIMVQGKPVQRVHKQVKFAIEYYDLTAGGEYTEGELVNRFMRPFDMSRAPLIRVGILKKAAMRYILAVDMHHITSDGVSHGILIQDFLALFRGEELPLLKLQYKDYSLWQQIPEVKETLKQQEQYWLRRFQGDIPLLALPADYPRPPVRTLEGNTANFSLGSQETTALNEIARSEGATLFMVLLAIYNIFLSKITSQEDIVVGTPIAGRRHADLEQIIGVFINTLPLRGFPSAGKTFLQFLREVKKQTLEDYKNQDYPFEEMVEKLVKQRNTSHNPLFDAMFVMQNLFAASGETSTEERGGLKIKPYNYEHPTAIFDLNLMAIEIRETLSMYLEYSTSLFRQETIDRFIRYFKQMVSGVIENPKAKIADLDMLTAEEKQQLLVDFNDTTVDYPGDKTIQELFLHQAQTTPDHIALEEIHEIHKKHKQNHHMSHMSYMSHMTYKELNKKSQQLAGLLQEKGVQPGTIVPVLLERSVEMIIALLGILKAGAAYLPIDPDYPQDRINYMLKDSGAKILLTREEIEGLSAPEAFNIRPKGTSFHLHLSPAPVTSLAYIIYTSGSTGRPKGVLVRQRGFVNLIYFHRKIFAEGPGSRMSQVANPGFDAMAFEVWPCLTAGAALVIADNETRLQPAKMKQWLIEKQITISFQPTIMAEQLLEETWPEEGAALKIIRTAGDRLTRYPTREYPFTFYNLYGPTEDTVWTTWTKIEPTPDARGFPPIGKPVGNHKIYITGSAGELQPIGVPGELCISGPGLAVGYLNNPELTNEKFSLNSVPSVSSVAKNKIYKTGDLARWLPDGNIEFLQRVDQQVKIRGFRIELGEIENQLLKHREIKDAVVLVKEDRIPARAQGEKYLCAYIVPYSPATAEENHPNQSLNISQLREYLLKDLPDYMIPADFVLLEKIPLTVSGKIDRKSLETMGERLETGVEYAAPRTDLEKQLVDMWQEILGVDRVGIHDNFFDLGGNSLSVISLHNKINQEMGKNVSVVVMFEHVTIDTFVNYLTLKEEETPEIPEKDREEILEKVKSRRWERRAKRKED